jgi:predicted oxidoreductase
MIFGTWRLLEAKPTHEHVVHLLQECLALGIDQIDTAEVYGGYHTEEFLGQALRHEPQLRSQLQFITKAGIYVPTSFHPERKVAFYNACAARLIKSAEKSLRLLGLERLDTFLIHRPDWLTPADETARGLDELVRSGKVRAVGVSNYNTHQFDLLSRCLTQPLVTNQIEFSLLHLDPIHDGTLDQCQQQRIRPMAWSPLAGGRIMDPQDPAGARLHQLAAELSEKYHGASLDQLAHAWILAHPARPQPVLGTHRLERLRSAALARSLKLEHEDWYALWTAAQGHAVP